MSHRFGVSLPLAVLLAVAPALVPEALSPADRYGLPAAYVPRVPLPPSSYAERVAQTMAVEDGDLLVSGQGFSEARPLTQSVTATTGITTLPVSDIYDPAAIPPLVLAAYLQAAMRVDQQLPGCHLSWTVLAGIGAIESGHARGAGALTPGWNGIATVPVLGPVLDGGGGSAAVPDTDRGRLDGNTRWDRAVGPMQFLPATWAAYGVDADGDGVANPQDIRDATAAAATYLCAGGLDLSDAAQLAAAVFSYNHADWYVSAVLTIAAQYAEPTPAGPRPAQSDAVLQAVLAFAYGKLGVPYEWGGTGPRYDCSGLTQAAFRSAGVAIPRTSEQQWLQLPAVDSADLQPGDLVFFNPGEFVAGLPGHVGIYIGDGKMIDAPRTGTVVRIEPIAGFGAYVGARRPSGNTAVTPVTTTVPVATVPVAGTPGAKPPAKPPVSAPPVKPPPSSGPPVVPPGHGGTPPGQASPPPGQDGTTPPGQSGDASGQSGDAPGQSGNAPGHDGTPPGQGGAAPGQTGGTSTGPSQQPPDQTADTPPDSGATGSGDNGQASGQSGDTPPGTDAGAPGQTGDAPGQTGETSSGQDGTAAGQDGTAAGQDDTTPGQDDTTPGQDQTVAGETGDAAPGESQPAAGQGGESTPDEALQPSGAVEPSLAQLKVSTATKSGKTVREEPGNAGSPPGGQAKPTSAPTAAPGAKAVAQGQQKKKVAAPTTEPAARGQQTKASPPKAKMAAQGQQKNAAPAPTRSTGRARLAAARPAPEQPQRTPRKTTKSLAQQQVSRPERVRTAPAGRPPATGAIAGGSAPPGSAASPAPRRARAAVLAPEQTVDRSLVDAVAGPKTQPPAPAAPHAAGPPPREPVVPGAVSRCGKHRGASDFTRGIGRAPGRHRA